MFLVFGRKPGQTTLYALSANDGVILSRRIDVAHDVGQVQAVLDEQLPRSVVWAQSTPAGIVLSGRVEISLEADQAVRIASGFSGSVESVIN